MQRWETLPRVLCGLAPAALVLLYLFVTGSLSLSRLQCLAFGSALLIHWVVLECRWSQGYHLLLGGLLIALAVRGPGVYPAAEFEVAVSIGGASWILAGLLDHRQLIRTLGQIPPPDLDEEVTEMEVSR